MFFCNPNNPTATVNGHAAVAEFVKQVRASSSDTVIMIDEAYHDYVTDPGYKSAVEIALATPNVFVTRTFSKAYGMAGLRMGYAIGHPPIIRRLQRFRLPFGIGTPHIAALVAGFNNHAHIDAERARNAEVRTFTMKAFADMGFSSTDSQSSFIFVNIKRPAAPFREACAAQRGAGRTRFSAVRHRPTAAFRSAPWPKCRRAVGVFRKVLGADPASAREKEQGDVQHEGPVPPKRQREGGGIAMSLSRRSFVQTLGAGAAGAWIGGRGLEGERFSLAALDAAEQNAAGGARLILSSNENPLGTPQPVLDAVRAALTTTGGRYPVEELDALSETIAHKHGVEPENVLLGSGSTQVLRTATHVFCSRTASLVAAIPAYEECADYAALMGYPVNGVKLNAELKMDLDAMLGAAKGRAWCSTATRTIRWRPRGR